MSPADGFALLSPVLVMVGTALLVLTLDLFGTQAERSVPRPALSFVALAGCALALALVAQIWTGQLGPDRDLMAGASVFGGTARIDKFGLLLSALIVVCAGASIATSMGYAARRGIDNGEYYCLILFAAVGMMLLVSSNHLVTLVVALETLSISVYALVGSTRGDRRSSEGAIKYFVQGAFSSGFLLYGVALVYGATASLTLPGIEAALAAGASLDLFLAGLALVLVGLTFKVGAVPFHWWVADAYDGAPSPITGFMASAVKVAGFGVLARILMATVSIEFARDFWSDALVVLSILTMAFGSVLALVQTNLKRLLAYSSIVHTGYAMIALVAAGQGQAEALASLPLYLIVYSLMTLGAFAAIAALERDGSERDALDDYRGLARRRPGVALALAVALLSLAGLPPTAGFVAKFKVFMAAVDARYAWLALLGATASMVSLYYYLRVVMILYMEEPEGEFATEFDPWGVRATLAASTVAVLVLGLLPGRVVQFAIDSARSLFAS